jgi:sugar phosphate isomerase/epimerase
MEAPDIGLCCGTVMKAGLLELIEVAARHGFPTITVRPATFAAALEQGVDEKALRRRVRDAGLRVTMIDALTRDLPGAAIPDISDPKLRALLPDEVFFPPDQETCLRAAEVLEAPFLNVTHFGGTPGPIGAMAEAVGAICRNASQHGVTIALEFVPGTGIPDIGSADAIARSCGEAHCRITLDPWHLYRSGGTLQDVADLPPNSIGGMQLCDRTPEPPGTPYVPMTGRRMPGEGELPLYDLVMAALTNSPGISIEVEVLNDELRALSPDEAASRVAASVQKWRAGFAAVHA